MGKYIDTRDLAEEREELKQQIYDAFCEDFAHYADLVNDYDDLIELDRDEFQEFKENWDDEITTIDQIDVIENEIGSEFEHGVTMIPEDDFEDYVEEFLKDTGYISRDMPWWIVIDWKETADHMKCDYSEVAYRGETYLVNV